MQPLRRIASWSIDEIRHHQLLRIIECATSIKLSVTNRSYAYWHSVAKQRVGFEKMRSKTLAVYSTLVFASSSNSLNAEVIDLNCTLKGRDTSIPYSIDTDNGVAVLGNTPLQALITDRQINFQQPSANGSAWSIAINRTNGLFVATREGGTTLTGSCNKISKSDRKF